MTSRGQARDLCMPSWIHPDIHDFFTWVFEALGSLNEFVRQVVTSRRDIGLRKWARWMHEDLGSRPYWLRADYVPPFLLLLRTKRLRPVVFWSQEDVIDLPRITGQGLFDVVEAERSSAGSLDGWPGMKLRHCRLLGFLSWRFCLAWWSLLVCGHRVCLMLILP